MDEQRKRRISTNATSRCSEDSPIVCPKCGLTCAPNKSELIIFRKGRNGNPIEVKLHGDIIQEVLRAKILGMTVTNNNNQEVIRNLADTTEPGAGMFGRITNQRRAMKESDALQIIQAFILSTIVYAAPYL